MVHYNKSKSKFYSLEHDKFLIYACYLEGFGNWDKVRMLIKREPLFRFDHFFKYLVLLSHFNFKGLVLKVNFTRESSLSSRC